MNQLNRSDYEEQFIEHGAAALANLDMAVNDHILQGDVMAFSHDISSRADLGPVLQYSTTYRSRVISDINPAIIHDDMPPRYLLDAFGALTIALVNHQNSLPMSRRVPALPPSPEHLDGQIQLLWMCYQGTGPLVVQQDAQSFPICLELVPDGEGFAVMYEQRINTHRIGRFAADIATGIHITRTRK